MEVQLPLTLPDDPITAPLTVPIDTSVAGCHAIGSVTLTPAPAVLALRAVLTLPDGSVHNVNATDGVDAGDYVGEFVHQKCIRCAVAGTDFTIFFRRDADGSRPEIVVERGKLWDKSIPPSQIQKPYQVDFYDGATLLKTIAPTAHWYFARWRWPNTPRPIVRPVSVLLQRKWIPPYSKLSRLNTASDTPAVLTAAMLYLNPMDCGTIWWDGSTGMRKELCLVTSEQADFILNGGAAAAQKMFSDAEVNASIPIHIRDEQTGAPLNVQAHPGMTMLRAAAKTPTGAPNPNYIDRGPVPIDPATGKPDKRYRITDEAHHPNLVGVPWMLTDDPYYAEELQFTANYCCIETAWWVNLFKNAGSSFIGLLPGLVNIGQVRGSAWGKRDQAEAAVFSPDSPPTWLLPKSVYRKNLADNLTYATKVMASPALVYLVYHVLPKVQGLDPWQRGYDGFVNDYIADDLGFTEWGPHRDWHWKGILDLVSGKSGWNRADPSPYSQGTRLFDNGFDSGYVPDTSQDAHTVPSYAALWAKYKAFDGFDDSAWDPAFMYTNSGGPDYLIIIYANVKRAAMRGVPEAVEPLAWMENAMTQVKHRDGTPNLNCFLPKGWAKWGCA